MCTRYNSECIGKLAASTQSLFGNYESRRLQFGGPSLCDLGKQHSNLYLNTFEWRVDSLCIHHNHIIQSRVDDLSDSRQNRRPKSSL